MPITKEGLLSAMIAAAGEPTVSASLSVEQRATALASAKAIQSAAFAPLAEAIVNYFKANATVTIASGIAVATTGSATAQTGTTTGPGTGTIS